ncbi:hypothetical protein [Thermus scotoductus]|uniref:hypothetical protein n=1 Tax=Thermus scotoductus TaxID=37636 RepID=UPI00059E4081|nr:hypothetical protein [Thermus scotoductus]
MRRIWLLFVLALSACAPSVTQPPPVYKATAQELIAYLMAEAPSIQPHQWFERWQVVRASETTVELITYPLIAFRALGATSPAKATCSALNQGQGAIITCYGEFTDSLYGLIDKRFERL